MKKEIKEILDYYKRSNKNHFNYEQDKVITYKEAQLLLDYITNLQEENERLYIQLEDKANEQIKTMYLEYKSRNEKAIEYILKLDKDYDINVYQEDKHWAMVLYILKGDKDE